jgi:hypothetical protein
VPAIEGQSRYQKAVLWAIAAEDDYGKPKVLVPREILVRWNDKLAEGNNPLEEVVGYDATAVVNEDIAIGSILWLGEVVHLPSTLTNLMKVVSFNSTPDIKNRCRMRTIGMVRFMDTLPEIAL